MNRDSNKQSAIILAVIGILPVVWLGLLIAPSVKGGLPEILLSLLTVFNDPFHIELCGDSLKTVLVLLLLYGMGIGIYLSTRRNYRRREEHGSAKWGSAKAIDKKYRQSPPSENKLMTQNVRIGLNAKKHRRNLNTLVCGGSGAGKTRFYCKPNLMQTSNSSQVILDPKGEILRDVGNLLEKAGYEIKVLDLISMEKSHCYNPFVYLRNDNDIQRLVTNLFKSTTPKGSQSNDPFWDTAASMLLLALVFYLHYEAPEEEQNFAMVMEMLRAAAIEDEEDNRPSPLDNLFADLEMDNPDHIALKYYRSYHSGSAKTLKSIQITLAARLEKFNLESLAALTSADELDLTSMGEKKTALFALIPDNDSSFNFLVSILYTQLFQQLFYSADHIHGGSLPIPVHFLMDEFANVSLPDDFDKILSVMRSRGVSVSIILQNLAQLKALFEKQWESIVGNCDEFLYLGGNEQSTHKYVSELLGKETIDTNTYGKSEGRSGSYSTNYQISGRELLTPDEVRMLDNRYAILFIRGELPVMDLKYDILKHPNVAYTSALWKIARDMTEENLEEAMEGLEYEVEGTFLEDLDEQTIQTEFRELLQNSIFYSLSRRCGLDPMDVLEEGDFTAITDFRSMSVLPFLGNATNQIVEPILRDIGRTVWRMDWEEQKEKSQKRVENSSQTHYNEFNTLMRESKENGGNENGTDILPQRGLPVSEPDNRKRTSEHREVRNASENIPEGKPEELVSEHVADRKIGETSDGNRESSTGENGSSDEWASYSISGSGQGGRSDEVGGTHEQSPTDGRGERFDGIGIQLSEEQTEQDLDGAEEEIASALSLPQLPPVEKQIREIEERQAALYAKEVTIPAEVVDEVLRYGGNRKGSHLRLIYNFMIEQPEEAYTEFVQKEYGKGGIGLQISGREYAVWYDELDMQIAVGHTIPLMLHFKKQQKHCY